MVVILWRIGIEVDGDVVVVDSGDERAWTIRQPALRVKHLRRARVETPRAVKIADRRLLIAKLVVSETAIHIRRRAERIALHGGAAGADRRIPCAALKMLRSLIDQRVNCRALIRRQRGDRDQGDYRGEAQKSEFGRHRSAL